MDDTPSSRRIMEDANFYPEDRTEMSRKRITQACDNCRRKKSRCPGEIPQCSLCERLKQRCVYSKRRRMAHRSAKRAEEGSTRLQAVEDSHEEMTTPLNKRYCPPSSLVERSFVSDGYGDVIGAQPFDFSTLPIRCPESPHAEYLPERVAMEAIHCYFQHLDSQPYPLLSQLGQAGLPSPNDLCPVVLYAMVALSLPVCSPPFTNDPATAKVFQFCSKSAWALLCKMYTKFEFDEAYFQGLCLLAQADFATGKIDRAQSQVTLGLKLAQLKGMFDSQSPQDPMGTTTTTRSAIVWTLFMMDRIIGTDRRSSSYPSTSFRLPVYQEGPSRPGSHAKTARSFILSDTMAIRSFIPSSSVTAVIIEMLDIWGDIIAHIFRSTPLEAVPFWQNGSSRAKIETRLLEFELKVKSHTYTSTGTPTRDIQDPQLRKYYSARFFLHVLHTGALCCLNHPFIIFASTQLLNSHVPWTFLQTSYKISTINSNWVVKLITDMEKSNISLHDPFVGYLVTIAATIQLDKSQNKNSEIADSARYRFERCREFVKKMSTQWPSMTNSLKLLNKLKSRLKDRPTLRYVEDEYDGMVQPRDVREVTLPDQDMQLMWSLFDYAAVSGQQNPDLVDIQSDTGRNERASLAIALSDEQITNQALQSPTASAPLSNNIEPPSFWEGDIPELNDTQPDDGWLLFGEPWTTYFPPDADSWPS